MFMVDIHFKYESKPLLYGLFSSYFAHWFIGLQGVLGQHTLYLPILPHWNCTAYSFYKVISIRNIHSPTYKCSVVNAQWSGAVCQLGLQVGGNLLVKQTLSNMGHYPNLRTPFPHKYFQSPCFFHKSE